MPKLLSHHATIFSVPDIEQALSFYRDKLGFSVEFLWQDPPSYAVLQRDEAVKLHLSQSENTVSGHGMAYVFVHDIDALHEEFRKKGLPVGDAPIKADYGMRDFDLADPWGNRLTFGMGS